MTCPEMADFSAWINLMPPSSGTLIVVGRVVTNGGDLQPKLTERIPQGINPQILILDLTIEQTGGPGTNDVAQRDVRFEKQASQGQHSTVEIYFEGEQCTSLEITEAH
ncbi:hypothetical protein K3552_13775 [Leisingera aquaemixtae]|uniref:hypothetical protein n=1 Tax=Leisingera aquaemixtae TaxID=1396826 RepID=UPI0021A6D63E|nr:hypothetical protein [Leisingera aquaemixtae]UWQ36564.1 hypothetical protein K3552_13775 [Leisingera aquaemixtae]